MDAGFTWCLNRKKKRRKWKIHVTRKKVATLLILIFIISTIAVIQFQLVEAQVSVDYEASIIKAADWLASKQNADGGFSWKLTEPLGPSGTNVLGITAMGILKAHELEDKAAYETALAKAYKYANDMVPGWTEVGGEWKESTKGVDSWPDVTFLIWLAEATASDSSLLSAIETEVSGTTASDIADLAKSRWDGRLNHVGAVPPSEVGTATAMAEWLRDLRHPDWDSLIPWDLEAAVKAALALDAYYPGGGYDQQARDIAEIIYACVDDDEKLYFDSTDTTQEEYILGLTGAIEAFTEVGLHTDKAANLKTILIDLQETGGYWNYYGSTPATMSVQSTAYAVMALLAQGELDAAINGGDWLVSAQTDDGGWYAEGGAGDEYLEVDSEAAWAIFELIQAIGTVDLDHGSDGTVDLKTITIQQAIDAADPDDTIYVAAGTYNERLTIDKSIDLRGAQYGVDPTQTGARTTPADESIIDLTGLPVQNPNVLIEIADGVSTVSVAGFTLIGSPTFHYADETIVRCWDNDITIEDNIMDGYRGVVYKGPGTGLTVHRNRMVVNKNGVVVQPGPASDVTVSDNVFTLGTSPDGDEVAIYMTACSQSSVTGNTATGFVNNAAFAGSNLDHLTVSGNTFTGNAGGISIWGTSTFITISDNVLSNSLTCAWTDSGCGICIKGQDVSITGNKITNNDDVGIKIDYHVISTERVTISYNDINDNTNYGVWVNTAKVTEIIHAENNWWGDASGPTHSSNIGGTGDAISDNVNYSPWLGATFETTPRTFHVNPTGTIQGAIDAAEPEDTVLVHPGTYTEAPRIDKALTVKSTDGAEETIIYGTSYYIVYIRHSDVTFDGFTVTYPTFEGSSDISGILVGAYLGEPVSNVHILNNIVKAVRSESGTPSTYGATGINIGRQPLSNVVVSGNTIENIHNPEGGLSDHTCGINIWDGAENVLISNNKISDIKYNGIILEYASNVQIENNTITECEVGIRVEPYEGATVSGLTVNLNNFADNSIQVLDVAEVLNIQQVLDTNTFDRAVVIDRPEVGSLLHVIYSYIQSAINDALTGDTILVYPGTYDPFTLDAKTDLTIEAVGDVTVEGAQHGVTVSYKGPADLVVFVKGSTNIVLDGLNIQGSGLAGTKINLGVLYEASTGTIRDCTVSPNTIGIMNSLAVSITDASDVTIERCTIENWGRVGVYVRGNARINDSTIVGPVYSGQDQVCYGVEVEQVTPADVPTTGSHVKIKGTEIYNCINTHPEPTWGSMCGIYINGWLEYDPQVDSTVEIENCDIHDNDVGIAAYNSSNSYAHFNNIYDNIECGVESAPAYDASTAVFDATNNWWGDASGPYPHGLGDKVSDNVDFDPWLGKDVAPGGVTSKDVPGGEKDYEVDAEDEADTDVFVNSTTGSGVTVAKYADNPGAGFSGGVDKYIDVHVSNPGGVSGIEIRLYYTLGEIAGLVEDDLVMLWWDGTAWVVCSDTGVTYPFGEPTYRGYIWARITDDTTPSLSDLGGTPFGSGTPIEVWVDDDWAGYSLGDPADGHVFGTDAFATIQDAVDAVLANSTIHVHPGTYTADGRVADVYKSNLTLRSTDGPEVTIIQSAGEEWCYGAIRIRGADKDTPTTGVTIDGFTVYNTGTWHHGIGILVGYWGYAPAHSNIVKNCIIGSAENYELSPSYGIYLGYTSGNLIENNTIYRARDVTGSEGIGIILWVHVLEGYYTSNTDNTLRDNTILDSDRFGICVGAWGAQVDVSGTIISGNTISGSGIAGIGVMYATGSITISDGNNIMGNNIGIQFISDVDISAINIYCNNIEGNIEYGVFNGATGILDATNNWWGDDSGPFHPVTNPTGQGNSVSDNVLYDPWKGMTTYGLLRLETDPPVPTTIMLNGIRRNSWGLNWVKLESGEYLISLTDVFCFMTPTTLEVTYPNGTHIEDHPIDEPITVYPKAAITVVIAHFEQLGNLRIQTDPPIPATLFVNDVPMNDWGVWVDLEPGTYTVSFEDIGLGFNVPPYIEVTVVANQTTHVIGNYTTGKSEVV